ncbi:hypothetical protein Bca4012_025230 [Brassica carinata]|uniref:Uncharacterized protein n=1 Tax=Brassica carinata TaxID=52824 RepID=A0A8X7VGF1_BRACI|nr:hypothetical protein Bca52824_022280 [Brassica carinata]
MYGKLLFESASLCSECSDREERSDISVGFCSCCEKRLGERHYPSYLLIKSSVWGKTLVDRENRGLILEIIDDDKIGDGFEIGRESHSFFRERPEEEEGKRGEQQQNGELISDVESYGKPKRNV